MLPSPSGGWDLFVAEIPGGLANWATESRCIHAVSSSRAPPTPNPLRRRTRLVTRRALRGPGSGPFRRKGVALAAECHNPQVVRERHSGDYLLFGIRARNAWLFRSRTPDGALHTQLFASASGLLVR
eukprot:COSAG04_NODE_6978_length_1216_cov_2.557744_1_plen_127_part_00